MSARDELVTRVEEIEGAVGDFINEARNELEPWLFERNEDDLQDVRRLLNVIYESLLTDTPFAHEVDQ